MASGFNVEQNKLTLVDGLLVRLFKEQNIQLKIDPKNQLQIPSDLKSKIQSMLNLLASLLAKTLKEKHTLSTNKQTELLIGNYYYYTDQNDKATFFMIKLPN